MPFPFTFSFSVPGLHNPFTSRSAVKPSRKDALLDPAAAISRRNRALPPPRCASPSPSLSPFVPLNRKRGWVPSIPEPSQAATSAASTRGYLDTPAKYRDIVHEAPEREIEEMFAELPPAKRRRTLAGSIVSTALSAALIGTAVGLTVYRLWRDRGKEAERIQPLPPPYHPGDWVPEQYKDIQVTPPTPKSRKPRPTPSSVRRSGTRHRRTRPRGRPVTPPRSVSPALMGHPPPEFDFVHVTQDEDEEEVEAEADEMDWIGDKLSQLIQEGHRALNMEVVVMSEAKEDEVDDGSGDWEEEQPAVGPSVSRRSSFRRTHRPRDIQPPSYSAFTVSPSPSSSPRKRKFVGEAVHLSPDRSDFSRLPVPSTPRRIARDSSMDFDAVPTVSSSFKEDESAWQSPELRESMERARAQYLQRRMGARS
ncbi:hypothetical protein DEU56DRAFT_790210 [Suillus clintonianus]|uniref:uncharacterized protein n=1 Tax=Suillus clintonianus TaxID=1904413 RepID=UPI001B861CA6|nr:uncharacterized protein DEU56DRAFT_790210 [Suillus clintonianus]KAG2144540.1 hypothetical protein DEU56DRAFT_790210 [Suillus clintonianus]